MDKELSTRQKIRDEIHSDLEELTQREGKPVRWKNPEVSVDECNRFHLTCRFKFEQTMTRKDAVEGITHVILKAIKDNGGTIPVDWLEYTTD
jgi:hypothetical protein